MYVGASRMANLFVAAATVGVTAVAGRRLAGTGAGLMAGLIVAMVPLSVETTTLCRCDPVMVLGAVGDAGARSAVSRRAASSVVRSGRRRRGRGGGHQVLRCVRGRPGPARHAGAAVVARAPEVRHPRHGLLRGGRRRHEPLRLVGLPELPETALGPDCHHRARPLGGHGQSARLLRADPRPLRNRRGAAGPRGGVHRLHARHTPAGLLDRRLVPDPVPGVHDGTARRSSRGGCTRCCRLSHSCRPRPS